MTDVFVFFKKIFSQHFSTCQMVFGGVSRPEFWSNYVDSRNISLPVMVELLSTLILNKLCKNCLTVNSEEFINTVRV